ncbi:MAG TPA: hypothetical protein VK737_09770 [Opitutales bacterium]|jgi:hypothetical protein|nr:hypothetical protein [Opitutales bacterium]
MSNHDETPSKVTLPRWFFSALGVAGSIVIIMVVLGVAYKISRPVTPVDADIVAQRKKTLADVTAAESSLYNNYAWANQTAKIVRIPVPEAMKIEAAKLDAATHDQPEPPARMSLAASPAGFTPPAPPPPASTAPAAGTAAPAATVAAPGSTPPSAAAPSTTAAAAAQ